MTLYILGISIVLQFCAAVRALQLIRLTGHRMSWGLIAIATLLMSVRRSITFCKGTFGDLVIKPDPVAELVALSISVCMVIGIFRIRSVFVELRQAKEESILASKAKSEFLANMSHEIRTPMTAVLGFAESMLDANQSETEKKYCIQTIRSNGEHLLAIINDILDLSKIEAGKMTIENRTCKPCQIIADVSSLMRVQADSKGLPFNIEYMGDIPETIQTDPSRIRQILINLVGNAIKFTKIGSVCLSTRLIEDNDVPKLQFDVIDTGCGLTEDQIAKLFQPFTQADSSTTRKFGGTGLGLAISKQFAEMLGGNLNVVMAQAGAGATFRVTIATGSLTGVRMLDDPMSSTIVEDEPHKDTETQLSHTDLQGCRILLAEDNPTNQVLVVGMIRKAGAEIIAVKDGKLALDAALAACHAGNPFDVILMDIQMPIMDGYEATRQLRQQSYTGSIIALTAHAMDGDNEKCINAGFNGYATKPINRQKLIQLILKQLQPAKA